jgi:hypothetical protein
MVALSEYLLSGEQEMGEEHLSNPVIGVGSVLFIAGTIQLFCRSVEIQRAKRGQVRVGLSFRSWSPRSGMAGRPLQRLRVHLRELRAARSRCVLCRRRADRCDDRTYGATEAQLASN